MKSLKRIISLILISVMSIVTFASCGGEEKTPDVKDVLKAVVDSQSGLEDMMDGTSDEFNFRYSLDSALYESFAMTYAGNAAIADEITVVKAVDSKAADEIKTVFEKRIQKRTNDFAGYVPEEEAKLKKSIVYTNGNYVVLIICPDVTAAKKAASDKF